MPIYGNILVRNRFGNLAGSSVEEGEEEGEVAVPLPLLAAVPLPLLAAVPLSLLVLDLPVDTNFM